MFYLKKGTTRRHGNPWNLSRKIFGSDFIKPLWHLQLFWLSLESLSFLVTKASNHSRRSVVTPIQYLAFLFSLVLLLNPSWRSLGLTQEPIIGIILNFSPSFYSLFYDYAHRRRKYGGSSPNSLRPISYFGSIWELYVLDPKTNVFCRKKIQLHFPMNKGLTVPK